MKAVFLDYATMGPGIDPSVLRDLLPELDIFDETPDELIAERIAGAELVFANKCKLNEHLLGQASNLRFVGLAATGTDNVDVIAAEKHGIAVCNIRDFCTQSVAEHVFGLLLTLTRSLIRYDALARTGGWQRSKVFCDLSYPMRELPAMTLGIVGYGALGHGVETLARAFGMNVIVSARPGSDSIGEGRVAFDDLLAQADVITLHCPLNDETRNLFDADVFARMKAGSYLINTGRGGLVDSAALTAALESGHLAGAGIDVLPQEPPVDGDPLLDYGGDNLVITPHVAWASNQARQNAIDELAANVEAFLKGEKRNRVV